MLIKTHDAFDIKNIFIFLTLYFVLVPFVFNVDVNTIIALIVVLLGTISFLIGYQHKLSIKLIVSEKRYIIKKRQVIGFVAVIFLIFDLLSGIRGLFASVIRGGDYTSSFLVDDHSALYLQIIFLTVSAIKYAFYSQLIVKGKIHFYLVFISQILLFYSSHTRLMALYPFIVFLIFGYYMGYIQVSIWRVLLAILFAPLLFVVLLLSRGGIESRNFFDLISIIISELTLERFSGLLKTALESFKSFEFLTAIIKDGFIHFESGVVRVFFMPISRDFWLDKPEAISRIISKEYVYNQYDAGGGSVATIFADAFINGSLIGVVLLLFILGGGSKLIYNTCIIKTRQNLNLKALLVMFYTVYIFDFIYYFRGFFSEFYWRTILAAVVFYVFYKLAFSDFLVVKNKMNSS